MLQLNPRPEILLDVTVHGIVKVVVGLPKEPKYRSELVELNLSGGNFSNRFFEDDTVADLNETELEELNLDDEVLTDNSQESSDSDYDNDFEDMVRKLLGINMYTKEYDVCPSCDTLYEVSEVINKQDKGFECTHVEFPSHPIHSQRKPCGVELTKQVPVVGALEFIKPRPTTGSLAANDGFDFADLYQFVQTFHQNIDNTITGSEPFPRKMLNPKQTYISLPDNIYKLLTEYYKMAYNKNFATIAEVMSGKKIFDDNII
ncbi:15867_t:CDS:2, partial [Racocetra fulgida]